jgi:hypothetical protein
MGKMKSKLTLAAAIVLLIPSMAFAKPKDSANVELDQSVTVAGTQLAPGSYKVTWEGSGPNTSVTFAQGKKIVATVPAKLVTDQHQAQGIETNASTNNTTVLQAIDLNKITLQFGDGGPSAGN